MTATGAKDENGYVSTGTLPPPERVQAIVDEAHARFRDVNEGECSQVYPALTRVQPDRFGICVAGVDGLLFTGDAEVGFTIMSVAKPFVFALVCDALGPDESLGMDLFVSNPQA